MSLPQTSTLTINVELYDIDLLLSAEPNIVNNELVSLYSPVIKKIFETSPLWIWVNPEDPTEIRVIDGLHRLFSTAEYNANHLDDLIDKIPCIVERCTKEEFLERRKQQTIAHGAIADYRGIEWLIPEYENKDFGISAEQKVPLEKLLALYISQAKDKGVNFLSKYGIVQPQLEAMKKFIDDWIKGFNIPGSSAYDIYNVLELLGEKNFKILGWKGMTRDYVKTAFSAMQNVIDMEERRNYVTHILQIALQKERARGWVLNFSKMVGDADEGFRERIMSATDFDTMHKIYEEFKLLKKTDNIESKVEITTKRTRTAKPDHNRQILKPGDILFDYKVATKTNIPYCMVLLKGAYITFEKENARTFYRVEGPYIFHPSKFKNAILYSIDNGKCVTFIGNSIENYGDIMFDDIMANMQITNQSALTVSASIINQPNYSGIARLIREDFKYSRKHKCHIIATPYEIIEIVLNNAAKAKNFIESFGDSIEKNENIFIVRKMSEFVKLLESYIK